MCKYSPDYAGFISLHRLHSVIADVLTKLYGTPDKCDAYVCGLAETKLPDNHFGPLFNASLTDQYLRTRDGDWWVQAGSF